MILYFQHWLIPRTTTREEWNNIWRWKRLTEKSLAKAAEDQWASVKNNETKEAARIRQILTERQVNPPLMVYPGPKIMALSQSRLAYEDCYRVMDQALADAKGIRVRMEDRGKGIYFRMRCQQARVIDRRDNMKTYEPGQFMYNRSAYDVLVIREPITDAAGNVWLQIDKPSAVLHEIESLTTGEEIPMIDAEYDEIQTIEDKTEEKPKAITFQRRI